MARVPFSFLYFGSALFIFSFFHFSTFPLFHFDLALFYFSIFPFFHLGLGVRGGRQFEAPAEGGIL